MVAFVLEELGKGALHVPFLALPVFVEVRDGERLVALYLYQQVGEAHAVVPQLEQFGAEVLQFGVDKNHRTVDIHIHQPLHDAQLRRGNGPAEIVPGADLAHYVVHIRHPARYQRQFRLFHRGAGFVEARVAEEEEIGKGFHEGEDRKKSKVLRR